MVSLPRTGGDSIATHLFPHAVSSMYRFSDSGYVASADLQPGTGYWVKHSSIDTLRSTGADLFTLAIPVHAGWNMIGTISTNVTASTATSNPPSIIDSPFYSFVGGYSAVQTLHPGKAYWIKVKQAGMLYIGGN